MFQYTAHITNEELRHKTGQPPVTSVIAKTTLSVRTSWESRPITRPLTAHASFKQPSIILQRIGDAGQVDQGGHGSIQSRSTFSPITLVSTQCGCVRRIVQSGVSLWRRLCSLMGALLDDDDDEGTCTFHGLLSSCLSLKCNLCSHYSHLSVTNAWKVKVT